MFFRSILNAFNCAFFVSFIACIKLLHVQFWVIFLWFFALLFAIFYSFILLPTGYFYILPGRVFFSCRLRQSSLSLPQALWKHLSCKAMSRSCHQLITALQWMVSFTGIANMQVLSSSCDKGHLCIKSIFCIKVFTPTLKKTKVSKVSKVSVHTTLVSLVLPCVG